MSQFDELAASLGADSGSPAVAWPPSLARGTGDREWLATVGLMVERQIIAEPHRLMVVSGLLLRMSSEG